MQTARQAVTALEKQYSLRQVSVKSLSDAIEKKGYTVIRSMPSATTAMLPP